MDCNNNNGKNWAWQREDYHLQKNSNHDAPDGFWSEVTLNKEDLSFMFDETTPVKACGDLAYHVHYSDNQNEELEECRETSSQLKRRRMLQFDNQVIDSSMCNEDISCAFLKSNEGKDSLEEVLPQTSQWIPGFPDVSASGYEGPDQSSDRWIDEYLNDTKMHFSPDDMNLSEASDIQIDISEFCNDPPEFEANMGQRCVPRTPPNIVFKGRKSFIETPSKLASSVAYPFEIIKPCAFQGGVTLKDINQWIRTPPPSKPKQKEDPVIYPTSAFSGKPVVGKTKIRTEGGKGSITIMRTKG